MYFFPQSPNQNAAQPPIEEVGCNAEAEKEEEFTPLPPPPPPQAAAQLQSSLLGDFATGGVDRGRVNPQIQTNNTQREGQTNRGNSSTLSCWLH